LTAIGIATPAVARDTPAGYRTCHWRKFRKATPTITGISCLFVGDEAKPIVDWYPEICMLLHPLDIVANIMETTHWELSRLVGKVASILLATSSLTTTGKCTRAR
jgi:hypothetical protein